MALLNRLFSTRKKSQKTTFIVNGKYEGESWRPYAFNKEQVRVLLFRECDWRGRKLLFDSNSVQRVSNEKSCTKLKFGGRPKCDTKNTNNLSSPSNGCTYQYTKANTDVSMLGEMIFGSVGMTFKGSAFKVHKIKSPTQLMCSKVFLSPKYHRKHLSSDRSLDDSCNSSFTSQTDAGVHRSSSDNRLTSKTGPLDVPWNDPYANLYPPASSYLQASEEDSGFCGDASLLSVHGSTSSGFGLSSGGETSWNSFGQSIGPPSNHGSGSFQSMQRRWLRSLHTSMELFCQNPSTCSCCSGPVNSGYLCGNASVYAMEENPHASTSISVSGGRRPKIGLAVLVTLLDPLKEQQADKDGQSDGVEEEKVNRESFFFEHASVVEEMLDRLRLATEKACYARKDVFIPLIMDACSELEQSLSDLFSAPRLSRPVWLGLLGQSGVGGRNHSTIALGFLEQLCQSLSNLDTKATNFFISTLITAVLTNHLGWVQTVVPQPLSKKQPNDYSLEGLSNSYPYNALWAQLGDLQGSLGYPPRLARTILTGKDTQVLNSLLFILTYFLRCGRIECSHEDGPIVEESSFVVKDVGLGKRNIFRSVVEKDNQKMLSPAHPIVSIPQSKFSPLSQSCHPSGDRFLQPRTTKDEGDAPKGLRRTSSHVSALGDSFSSDNAQPALVLEPDVISEKVQRLCRVPTSAILYHLNSAASSREDVDYRNESSSEVVFVLGDNEKLVGLKGKVPPVQSAEEVTTAEEVMEGSETGKVCRGGGKVALGDQITALAGEFLSRCKEGIRLAGKAADSIGVVGGRANLPLGRVTYFPDPRNGISKSKCEYEGSGFVRNVNGVEDSLCSRCSYGESKIESDDFSGDKITSVLNRRNVSCYSFPKENDERTHTCLGIGDCEEDGEFVSCRSEKSKMKWLDKIRTHECDGVEEFVYGRERNSSVSTLKPEFNVEDVDDIYPIIDTSELPSFDKIITIELPMPKSVVRGNKDEECKCGMGWGLASSLLGATTDHYIPHMVLQGITSSRQNGIGWENRLRRDLLLSIQYPIYHNHPQFPHEFSSSPYPVVAEPDIAEAVCVLANTDTWEVQLVSSRPCLVDRPGTLGVRVGMSQLVANMLESLLVLWRLRTPPEYCLLHLESKLREIWLRSQSLAQLLLTTEFCNMARVTTALDLEANDVPLLLAVASTHTPQVTLRYGLSFR